jgi:hypothetical protein
MKSLFDESAVPAPRPDLADRILLDASDQAPLTAANDRKPWALSTRMWSGAAGIAAMLVVGLFVIGNQPTEADLWAAQANDAGFGELYAWVDGEPQGAVQ